MGSHNTSWHGNCLSGPLGRESTSDLWIILTKGQWSGATMVSFFNILLNKQRDRRWFEMFWCACYVTVMMTDDTPGLLTMSLTCINRNHQEMVVGGVGAMHIVSLSVTWMSIAAPYTSTGDNRISSTKLSFLFVFVRVRNTAWLLLWLTNALHWSRRQGGGPDAGPQTNC